MKFAIRFAAAAAAACTAGLVAAPLASATPVTPIQAPATVAAPDAKDYWVVRLDAATTRAVGSSTVSTTAIRSAIAAHSVNLPEDLENAAFYLWVASLASSSTVKMGPNACVEVEAPVTQHRDYATARSVGYRDCPWRLPSVTRTRY